MSTPSGKWSKLKLLKYADALRVQGVDIPSAGVLYTLSNAEIADLLKKTVHMQSDMFYGYAVDTLLITKEQFAWSVRTPGGKSLVNIDWTHAFKNNWEYGDFRAPIIEACLVQAPLTGEDIALLESKLPGSTQAPFKVDWSAWEEVDDDDDEIDAEFEEDYLPVAQTHPPKKAKPKPRSPPSPAPPMNNPANRKIKL